MTFEEILAKLPKPYYSDEAVVIYHSDCRLVLPLIPDKSIDLVLTDPPYPDQHPEYGDCDILFLNSFNCRQLVFWSAKVEFPLNYTAIHIWDKKSGAGSQYERLFERNGNKQFNVYRYYLINSSVAANFTRDILTGHPSQKPHQLINKLVADFSKESDLILDPFLGSGTIAYCAKKLGRKCIGIEIEEKYCEIAARRCQQGVFKLDINIPESIDKTAPTML